MPHWSETKWLEISERKRIVGLLEKRGRKGLPIPAWWLPIARDYYEQMKTEAQKAGDRRAYRLYTTKQQVFSLMAKRAKPNMDYERNPKFDFLRAASHDDIKEA